MIGDGESYQAWTVDVANLGGVATTWPFGWNGQNSGPYTGAPAARFDTATFQQLLAAGTIGANDPVGMTTNGAYVYVLAPSSVVDSAPSSTQMSVGSQIANFFFSDWDQAIAAFPGQLATEIKGVVGYAANVAGTIGAGVADVVKDTVAPLFTAPVLIGGAVVIGLVALIAFRKR